MNYLKRYTSFILEEWSKNEPIPEIIGIDRGLAVFVIGSPGIGKSYFVTNHIHSKNPNIKDFSTDDVSLLYTEDPNVYYRGRELPEGGRTKNASELNLDRMEKFMETGQNFIYDTTGAGKEFTDRGFEHIKEIYDKARVFGYKVIFIHLLSTLQTSIDQDALRTRHVDPHYIQWAYAKQMGGEVDGQKVEGNMQRYKDLGPDAYYLVTSINKKYKFYKFIDGKLAVRKNDRYVIKESVNLENEVDNIIETMIDIIEEGETITFGSATGDMNYQDYLDKNDRYKNFKPVIVSKNKTVSKFNIIYVPNNAKYENIINILEGMQPVIGRLSDNDWVLSDFQVTSKSKDVNNEYGKDASIDSLIYEFTKPDVIHNQDENSLPDSKELKRELERMGIGVSDITVYDYETEVEFFSNSYDGELRSESFYDDRFEKICDIFGFSSYDTDYRRPKVIFEH